MFLVQFSPTQSLCLYLCCSMILRFSKSTKHSFQTHTICNFLWTFIPISLTSFISLSPFSLSHHLFHFLLCLHLSRFRSLTFSFLSFSSSLSLPLFHFLLSFFVIISLDFSILHSPFSLLLTTSLAFSLSHHLSRILYFTFSFLSFS